MDDDIQLIHGEMLETMRGLEAQSLDAIITDLPYGTTACKWDNVIPFAPMWEAVKHVLKPRGAFVTTASQPFTSLLIVSNLERFKYEWIWRKNYSADLFTQRNAQCSITKMYLSFTIASQHITQYLRSIQKPQKTALRIIPA